MARLRADEAAARDAVSETFLAAMREIQRFDPQKGSVAAWLMGIARHKIADARRTRKLDELPDEAIMDCDPAAPAMLEETRIAVGRVMVDLGDDYRMALEWKYIDGLSVRDIASRIGRDEKATEALLYRAREEFRKRAGHLMDAKGATDG
jgi:RNA polymerase sigma-70 factor, ECF subfamily